MKHCIDMINSSISLLNYIIKLDSKGLRLMSQWRILSNILKNDLHSIPFTMGFVVHVRRISTPLNHMTTIQSSCLPLHIVSHYITIFYQFVLQFGGGLYSAKIGGSPYVNPKSWCKIWTKHGFSLGSLMGFVTSKYSNRLSWDRDIFTSFIDGTVGLRWQNLQI